MPSLPAIRGELRRGFRQKAPASRPTSVTAAPGLKAPLPRPIQGPCAQPPSTSAVLSFRPISTAIRPSPHCTSRHHYRHVRPEASHAQRRTHMFTARAEFFRKKHRSAVADLRKGVKARPLRSRTRCKLAILTTRSRSPSSSLYSDRRCWRREGRRRSERPPSRVPADLGHDDVVADLRNLTDHVDGVTDANRRREWKIRALKIRAKSSPFPRGAPCIP